MEPTLGQMVHYVLTEEERHRHEGRVAPGLITRVLDPTAVNITVFLDGGTTLYKPEVKLADKGDKETPGTWFFPRFVLERVTT